MSETCHAVRDDLAPYTAGTLPAVRAQQIDDHLESCAECRTEHALIMLLRTPHAVPAELAGRVRRAAALPVPADHSQRRVLAAAAVAATILGGAIVALQWTNSTPEPAAVPAVETAASELGWAARTDPVLHEGPGLSALSDEELEVLLEEMQS